MAVDRNVSNVPAGKRLYFRTSQRTSLFGSSVNGSLKMRTGLRYMSLLEPSAWYVLEPSKFHSGMSDDKNVPKGHHQNMLLYFIAFPVSIPVKCFIYRISAHSQQSLYVFSFASLADMQLIMTSNQKRPKEAFIIVLRAQWKIRFNYLTPPHYENVSPSNKNFSHQLIVTICFTFLCDKILFHNINYLVITWNLFPRRFVFHYSVKSSCYTNTIFTLQHDTDYCICLGPAASYHFAMITYSWTHISCLCMWNISLGWNGENVFFFLCSQ